MVWVLCLRRDVDILYNDTDRIYNNIEKILENGDHKRGIVLEKSEHLRNLIRKL